MHVEIRHTCEDFNSYRAARVKSLFNAEDGASFELDADLPIDGDDWSVGLIVGPSGSGKTSLGRRVLGPEAFYEGEGWPRDAPIVDAISPGGDFNDVTGALAAVGLGDVPCWLRPYHVLSNGQQFRADLARVAAEAKAGTRRDVVIDEFTSVVDRQIAKIGAQAFAKAWRRTGGKAVLLSCHYDIAEWLEPDWVFDTGTARFSDYRSPRDRLQRPTLELHVQQTDASYWPLFKPHYYLDLPLPIAASYYVGTVDGEPVCHLAVSPKFETRYYRATRLVVMPEWQGAGVGTRFLNHVCQRHLEGGGLGGRKYRTLFHTSHPQLVAYLRRSSKWIQLSRMLYGGQKSRSRQSMARSKGNSVAVGYGGHFRAVQGFAYVGDDPS